MTPCPNTQNDPTPHEARQRIIGLPHGKGHTMDDFTDHASSLSTASLTPEPAPPTRRRLFALLGAGALIAGLAALPGAAPVAGKKKRRKGKGKGKKGGKGKGGNGGGGTNPPPPPPPPTVEEQVLALINAHRDDNGQAALTWNDQLGAAAQTHSDDMTANNFSSHTGSDGSTPLTRITNAGYPTPRYWGENIFQSAPNDPSAQSAFDWWKNSDGHNANMLNPNYTDIGIGQATDDAGITRWTTNFGSVA